MDRELLGVRPPSSKDKLETKAAQMQMRQPDQREAHEQTNNRSRSNKYARRGVI
jgi:hypothetical protein